MADFFILRSLTYNEAQILSGRGLEQNGKVQSFIDSEALRLSEPYVPLDQGGIIDSGITHTIIGSGQVKYRTLYARKWYYMPANFQGAPRRGNYWFERMKNEGGKEKILAGAKKLAGAK